MLSSEECKLATHILRTSWVFLEDGGDKEGFWTGEKCIANVRDAAAIANFIPANSIPYCGDLISCHRAYGEDALNARKMNVCLGEAQPRMREQLGPGKCRNGG